MRISLQEFLADAGESQVRAWDDSIPRIQVELGEVVEIDELAEQYTAILEYELPLESRRPDVVLLVSGAVVVLELKGKAKPEQADLDQAAAYARDLRCYHSTAQTARCTRCSCLRARTGTRVYATACISPAPTRCTG